MTASVGPSPNCRNLAKTLRIPAMLCAIVGIVEQLARLVLAGRVADLRRAAAHQHDRLVAGLLEQAQQHDRQQIADMQAVGGAIIADIGGQRPGREPRVEPGEIGALMDVAALGGGGEKGGTVGRGRHGGVN